MQIYRKFTFKIVDLCQVCFSLRFHCQKCLSMTTKSFLSLRKLYNISFSESLTFVTMGSFCSNNRSIKGLFQSGSGSVLGLFFFFWVCFQIWQHCLDFSFGKGGFYSNCLFRNLFVRVKLGYIRWVGTQSETKNTKVSVENLHPWILDSYLLLIP